MKTVVPQRSGQGLHRQIDVLEQKGLGVLLHGEPCVPVRDDAGDDRLAVSAGQFEGGPEKTLRRRHLQAGHVGMAEDDPIDPVLGQGLLHDPRVGVDVEDVPHVQGVGHADHAGPEMLPDMAEEIIGERGEFEPVTVHRVSQQDGLPPRAAQHGQPRPLDDGKRKNLEALHHLGEVLDPMDPGLAEGRRDDLVVPGECRRVKLRRPVAHGIRVGLQDDERLVRPARQPHQPGAVGHVLQVAPDDTGVGVGIQKLDEIVLVDVELVAHADELARAEVLVGEQAHAVDRNPSALGHDRDVALPHLPVVEGHERQGKTVFQVDNADAVRSHDAHAPPPRDVEDLIFEVASLIRKLAEPARFDDDPPDALAPAGLDRPGDVPRGQQENGQLRDGRDVVDRRVDAHAVDLAAVLADGVDGPLEAEALKVQDDVAGQIGG